MSIRPELSIITKQIIARQKINLEQEWMGKRLQPYDLFIKKSVTNKIDNKVYSLDEALRILSSYQIQPSPINFTAKLGLPLNYFKFPKDTWLPVDPKIIPNSKSPIVMVFAENEEALACKDAGAEYVGGRNLVQKLIDYNMVAVDECFCELSFLHNISKILPILGKYSPNTRKSTACNNVSKYVKVLKMFNFIDLNNSQNHLDFTIKLFSVNEGKDKIKGQINHIIEQIKLCRKSMSADDLKIYDEDTEKQIPLLRSIKGSVGEDFLKIRGLEEYVNRNYLLESKNFDLLKDIYLYTNNSLKIQVKI